MITVSLRNEDTIDLFVVVFDNNQPGIPQIFNDRLDATQPQNLQVQEDQNGLGDLAWIAQDRTDGNTNTGNATPAANDVVPVWIQNAS